MKRSTLILGFALLIVAATLAVTITVRNDPRRISSPKSSQTANSPPSRHPHFRDPDGADYPGRPTKSLLHKAEPAAALEVVVPAENLVGLTSKEQTDLRHRAALVEREARRRLEKMTDELDLTGAQRRKIFPVLAHSVPGYDPVMQVGGAYLAGGAAATGTEEVHRLIDPAQQEELEDRELNRQLWWQDLFARLEAELFESTGLAPADGGDSVEPDAAVPAEDRQTPAARTARPRAE